jgi:ADP-ribose pyrophosphatase YjhB (NUDIX family)
VGKPNSSRLRQSSACAIVFDANGKLLLHRRSDTGYWALPGGAIELDETAAQAVIREVREETGYHVEIVRIIGVYSDPIHTTIRYPNGDVVSYVAIAFECKVSDGHRARLEFGFHAQRQRELLPFFE